MTYAPPSAQHSQHRKSLLFAVTSVKAEQFVGERGTGLGRATLYRRAGLRERTPSNDDTRRTKASAENVFMLKIKTCNLFLLLKIPKLYLLFLILTDNSHFCLTSKDRLPHFRFQQKEIKSIKKKKHF